MLGGMLSGWTISHTIHKTQQFSRSILKGCTLLQSTYKIPFCKLELFSLINLLVVNSYKTQLC